MASSSAELYEDLPRSGGSRHWEPRQGLARFAALHMAQGREVWGHVATRLLSELPESPPAELIERARVLDNYHVPDRYPNGHVEGPAYEHYGSLHSFQAVDHARDILTFVRQALAEA